MHTHRMHIRSKASARMRQQSSRSHCAPYASSRSQPIVRVAHRIGANAFANVAAKWRMSNECARVSVCAFGCFPALRRTRPSRRSRSYGSGWRACMHSVEEKCSTVKHSQIAESTSSVWHNTSITNIHDPTKPDTIVLGTIVAKSNVSNNANETYEPSKDYSCEFFLLFCFTD